MNTTVVLPTFSDTSSQIFNYWGIASSSQISLYNKYGSFQISKIHRPFHKDIQTLIGTELYNLLKQTSSLIEADLISLLPPNIRSTVKALNITNNEIIQLKLVRNKIEDFLETKNTESRVSMETFIDPEYPEWIALKIVIKIKNLSSTIYHDIESKIYDILDENITNNLYQKLIIKIHSL